MKGGVKLEVNKDLRAEVRVTVSLTEVENDQGNECPM